MYKSWWKGQVNDSTRIKRCICVWRLFGIQKGRHSTTTLSFKQGQTTAVTVHINIGAGTMYSITYMNNYCFRFQVSRQRNKVLLCKRPICRFSMSGGLSLSLVRCINQFGEFPWHIRAKQIFSNKILI